MQDNRRNSVSDGSDTAPVADLIYRAYLYGLDAVPEQECRELRERLAADCAARAEFRRVVRLVRESLTRMSEADAREPPPYLEERILSSVSPRGGTSRAARWWSRLRARARLR